MNKLIRQGLTPLFTAIAMLAATVGTTGTAVFTDNRNGKSYKTVKMPDGKTWLAENLNYETDESLCCLNDSPDCAKYGRLYDWETALTICPAGWRLPTRWDWGGLGRAVGGESKTFDNGTVDWYGAGRKLKSKTGWDKKNGTDEYGFSALPLRVIGRGSKEISYSQWWTSSERGVSTAYRHSVGRNADNKSDDDLMEYYIDKNDILPVRCVQVKDARTVTVSNGATGAKKSGSYAFGDTVTITAGTTSAGLRFKKWTSSDREAVFADANNATTTFIMPNKDIAVTALFDTVVIVVKSGTTYDSRDDRTYKTVIMGGKLWTAENIDYETPEGSLCYGGSADSCAKYGRLYTWRAAMGACPAGWRLPTHKDWGDLARAVGGRSNTDDEDEDDEDDNKYVSKAKDWYGAGKTLKAKSGFGKNGNGRDEYGFSALPGGYFNSDGFFTGAGDMGVWWSATEAYGMHHAYASCVFYRHGYMNQESFYREQGSSVRCIRDTGAINEKQEREQGKKIGQYDAKMRKDVERRRAEEERRIEDLSTYFTDSRDGKRYRAVKIGDLKWMAENLMYKPKSGGSWCYYDDTLYCNYGRLYDWNTAKTACPSGWRLPSRNDWNNLAETVGGRKEKDYNDGTLEWFGVDKKLKSKSGWDPRFPVRQTDDFGFSARPNGSRESDGTFISVGLDGQSEWWTSAESGGKAFTRSIGYYRDSMREYKAGKKDGEPIRCVADGK